MVIGDADADSDADAGADVVATRARGSPATVAATTVPNVRNRRLPPRLRALVDKERQWRGGPAPDGVMSGCTGRMPSPGPRFGIPYSVTCQLPMRRLRIPLSP